MPSREPRPAPRLKARKGSVAPDPTRCNRVAGLQVTRDVARACKQTQLASRRVDANAMAAPPRRHGPRPNSLWVHLLPASSMTRSLRSAGRRPIRRRGTRKNFTPTHGGGGGTLSPHQDMRASAVRVGPAPALPVSGRRGTPRRLRRAAGGDGLESPRGTEPPGDRGRAEAARRYASIRRARLARHAARQVAGAGHLPAAGLRCTVQPVPAPARAGGAIVVLPAGGGPQTRRPHRAVPLLRLLEHRRGRPACRPSSYVPQNGARQRATRGQACDGGSGCAAQQR